MTCYKWQNPSLGNECEKHLFYHEAYLEKQEMKAAKINFLVMGLGRLTSKIIFYWKNWMARAGGRWSDTPLGDLRPREGHPGEEKVAVVTLQ